MRTSRPKAWSVLWAVLLLLLLNASCSRRPISVDSGAGGETTDYENPIYGVPISGPVVGDIAFSEIVPPRTTFGDPTRVLISPIDQTPVKARVIVLQYQLQPYGLVDISESLNQASDWSAFVNSWVGAFETPTPGVTLVGSALRFQLPDGSLALITTAADGSTSDISWLDPTGSIQLAIEGPSLSQMDVQKLASSFVSSYMAA